MFISILSAKKTKLTDRTIRNYLANGTLKGKKIGGQWRFTQSDINELFNNEEFADDMLTKSEKNIGKYLKKEFTFESENNVCSIINVVVKDKADRKAMWQKIVSIEKNEDVKERISFFEEDGHIKIIIIGPFDKVYQTMEVIKEVIDLWYLENILINII